MQFSPVYRIKLYCPPECAEPIIAAVLKVVSLRYGNYDCVAWTSSAGVEQFRPLSGAKPAVGDIHQVTRGDSVKIEFSVPRDEQTLQQVVVQGIFPVHPWDEPVILISEELETRRNDPA